MSISSRRAAQEAADRMMAARVAFTLAYCAERSWDPDDLSIGQIMEIRAQPEWVAGGVR